MGEADEIADAVEAAGYPRRWFVAGDAVLVPIDLRVGIEAQELQETAFASACSPPCGVLP